MRDKTRLTPRQPAATGDVVQRRLDHVRRDADGRHAGRVVRQVDAAATAAHAAPASRRRFLYSNQKRQHGPLVVE